MHLGMVGKAFLGTCVAFAGAKIIEAMVDGSAQERANAEFQFRMKSDPMFRAIWFAKQNDWHNFNAALDEAGFADSSYQVRCDAWQHALKQS